MPTPDSPLISDIRAYAQVVWNTGVTDIAIIQKASDAGIVRDRTTTAINQLSDQDQALLLRWLKSQYSQTP